MVGIKTPDTPESFPAGVTALTAVPHGTVMAMWDRALFGVFPSKWPEPLATVVHEAMSRGRPVIGTTPGGHEDMIDDGETGFLVPGGDAKALAEAMARLVEDERCASTSAARPGSGQAASRGRRSSLSSSASTATRSRSRRRRNREGLACPMVGGT